MLIVNELLFLKGKDLDTSDVLFDAVVTCCLIDTAEFKEAIGTSDEYYYRFCKYIYDNVFVSDMSLDLCDYTGFVQRHREALKGFMRENWKTQYEDENDFIYEWIKEIHSWLAGYVSESTYKEFLDTMTRYGYNANLKSPETESLGDRIVRLEIVDNEPEYGKNAVLDVYYLKNPDIKKIEKLQAHMNARFDCDDEDYDKSFEQFDRIKGFVEENFETLNIETVSVEW